MANHVEARPLAPAAPIRFLKLVWGAVATLLAVLYTVLLGPGAAVAAALGMHRGASAISRFWGWLIIKTCGVKVDIEGLEHLRDLKSYVLVCNHQSFFDIFAVVAFMPGDVRFVAKKELLRIPLVGYTLRKNLHIVIDRQSGGKSIRRAMEAARNNYPICVVAEGHRFNDNQVHEFSDGAAWLAITTRLPCVPMAIMGSGAFFPRQAKVVVPGGRMRMKICAPISVEGAKSRDRVALTKQVEDAVRGAFDPDWKA